MSLRKRILLGILLVLLVCIGVTAFLLRDEIAAIYSGLRYSSEELEQQLADNEQTIKDAAQVIPDFTIRDITEQEKQALKDGTLTKEELIQSIIEPIQPPASDTTDTTPGQSTKPQGSNQPETNVPGSGEPGKQGGSTASDPQTQPGAVEVGDYQKQLASIIAEVYVLREEFLIKLDNLMAQAKAEYLSLPAKDRNKTKLASLAGKYYSQAYALEAQCDSRMREIVDRMKTLLQENGADLSIADSVMSTYLSEKSLKKSWYLAELKKRGI